MKKLYIILAVLLLAGGIKAQYANQQVLFKNLPQAKYLNPGLSSEYTGYFSLPMLSGYGVSVSNSGFAFKDAFTNGDIDLNNLLSTVKDNNFINLGISSDIIAFGFKSGKNNFSFNLSPKTDINFSYSKPVLDFLINGNGGLVGQTLSLDGLGFNVSSYLESGIGYSRELTDKLTVGARFKIISGLNNLSADLDGVSLHTSDEDYSLTANSEFGAYSAGLAPYAYVEFMSDLLPNLFGAGNVTSNNPLPKFTQNLGLGLDLGADYKLSDKISLFGSVVDLGYIKWADQYAGSSKTQEFLLPMREHLMKNFFKVRKKMERDPIPKKRMVILPSWETV